MNQSMCYDYASYTLFILIIRETSMSIIATLCAVGTAAGAVFFTVWMLKQLFTGK
jgi:hypothetical protein